MEIAEDNAAFFEGIVGPFLISPKFRQIILRLEEEDCHRHHPLEDAGFLKVEFSSLFFKEDPAFLSNIQSKGFLKNSRKKTYGNLNQNWIIWEEPYLFRFKIEQYEKAQHHANKCFRIIQPKNFKPVKGEHFHRIVQLHIG